MSTRNSSPSVPLPDGSMGRLLAVSRLVGFWAAVVLPLAYVPAIALLPVAADPVALSGAVGANLVAILLGHGHDP